jgi:cell division protein FtsL
MAMNDNLARQINMQPQVQPQTQPTPQKQPVHSPRPSRRGLTRIEVAILTFFGFVLFGLLVANIALAMQVSTTSRSVQDITRQTEETHVVNENLQQNVQELSRYDRVYQIAKEHGLEVNEENIRNVLP